MTIENFENLNTPTESKIANTTVKTFKDLTIDLNKKFITINFVYSPIIFGGPKVIKLIKNFIIWLIF